DSPARNLFFARRASGEMKAESRDRDPSPRRDDTVEGAINRCAPRAWQESARPNRRAVHKQTRRKAPPPVTMTEGAGALSLGLGPAGGHSSTGLRFDERTGHHNRDSGCASKSQSGGRDGRRSPPAARPATGARPTARPFQVAGSSAPFAPIAII